MDDRDRHLLTVLQKPLPVQSRPFEQVAKTLGVDEAEVLLRITALKEDGVIRGIHAVFDKKRLGYKTTLMALQIPENEFEQRVVSAHQHPGIWQSYKRSHPFNWWITLGIPEDASFEDHARAIHQLTGSGKTLVLPVLRCFKPVPSEVFAAPFDRQTAEGIGSDEIEMIRVLQEEFPVTDRPFEGMARSLGMDEDVFLNRLGQLKRNGCFRGIYASLPRRGEEADNVLIAWRIPEERMMETGRKIAGYRQVKTCLERPFYGALPYSLYATAGFRDETGCDAWLHQVEEAIGKWPHLKLFRRETLKKSRLKLFNEKLHQWPLPKEAPVSTEEVFF